MTPIITIDKKNPGVLKELDSTLWRIAPSIAQLSSILCQKCQKWMLSILEEYLSYLFAKLGCLASTRLASGSRDRCRTGKPRARVFD